MLTLVYLSLAIFFSILVSFIINKRNSVVVISNQIIISIFYIIIMIGYFFVNKYFGMNNIIFPDERTYLYGVSSGFFGEYVKIIYKIGGMNLVRSINLFVYLISTSIFLNCFEIEKLNYKIIIIEIVLAINSYWTFFILKEAFTISGILLYLVYYKNKNIWIKFSSLLLLFVSRVEFMMLFIIVEILFFIRKRSKKISNIIIFMGIIFVINYLSSPMSYKIKLSALARRYGETKKTFDSVTISTAKNNIFSFVISKPYFETVKNNIIRSIWPFSSNGLFEFILILINFISLIIFSLNLKQIKFGVPLAIFVTTISSLLFTHSVFRYINSIIIPFSIYFLLIKSYKCRS